RLEADAVLHLDLERPRARRGERDVTVLVVALILDHQGSFFVEDEQIDVRVLLTLDPDLDLRAGVELDVARQLRAGADAEGPRVLRRPAPREEGGNADQDADADARRPPGRPRGVRGAGLSNGHHLLLQEKGT